jgi:alkylation response protein AidB-like acyl-CoA dehydrogenase
VDLSLNPEQQAVREAFATLFAKESTPSRVRAVEADGFDPRLWSTVQDMGAVDVGIPTERGGGGGGLLELSLIAQEAGRWVAPIPFAEPPAAARLCAEVGAGDLVAAIVEGAQLVSLCTRRSGLAGQLLADGSIADVVVSLEGDRLVANSRPAEVRAVPNLGGLPLARWDPLGPPVVLAAGEVAVDAFERACDDVRLLRAAALFGLTSEAIEIGAAYARERLAFGVPIGSYQAVAHPLADAVTANDGLELLIRKAAWALDEALPSGPTLASKAFVFAAETAQRATQHSLHIHGGYGFTQEYDIQLYYRRAKAWSVVFADPAHELLTLADRLYGQGS